MLNRVSAKSRFRLEGLAFFSLAMVLPFTAISFLVFNVAEGIIYFAVRGLQIMFIGTLVSLLTRGSLEKSITGAQIGAIFVDLLWILYVVLFLNLSLFVITANPFVWIGLIVCSTATAPNRIAAIAVGWVLLLIVGLAIVWSFSSWQQFRLAEDPGLIINGPSLLIVAACTIVFEIIGMILVVVARLIIEAESGTPHPTKSKTDISLQ